MAALSASLLTRGKAGSAHIFHSSSHTSRLTGSVNSHRSAVLQQVGVSLWLLAVYETIHGQPSWVLSFCVCSCSVTVEKTGSFSIFQMLRAEFDLPHMKKFCCVCAAERLRESRWLSGDTKVPEGNLLWKCQHQLEPLHFPQCWGDNPWQSHTRSFVVRGSFCLYRAFDWCSVCIWIVVVWFTWSGSSSFHSLFSCFLFCSGYSVRDTTSSYSICSSSPSYGFVFLIAWLTTQGWEQGCAEKYQL